MKKLRTLLFVVIAMLILACGCESDENQENNPENPLIEIQLPTLSITEVNEVLGTSAKLTSGVITTGSSLIIDKGFVWGTSPNPTISNNSVSLGQGNESFSVNIESLEAYTKYYTRAYARNDEGISYSEEITFETLNGLIAISTTLLNADIFHNKESDLLYFTSYERDVQGNPVNPMKISVFDYSKNQITIEKEFDNITWTDYSSRLFESTGYHNDRTELYIINDFGEILILDGESLEVIGTIPSPNTSQIFRSKVIKINDFLVVANSSTLYVFNRNTLELVNTISSNVNERGIVAYNDFNTNELVVVSFNTFSTNSSFRVQRLDLQGNQISSESYDRELGGGRDLLRTNDMIDFILTGSETAILWKSDFQSQGEHVFDGAKDIYISEEGNSLYILGFDSILRTYDADDLLGLPTELPVVSTADNVFVDDDQIVIIDYPFWTNQSEEFVDVWIYYY